MISLFICLLSLGVCRGYADIHFVTPGSSIQTAINEASDLDTILIEDGVYDQTSILYGKTLVIGSRYLLDSDTSHILSTVIRGSDAALDTGSCFVYAYNEGEEGRLIGLTLQGTRGTYWEHAGEFAGGAVYVIRASATIEKCIIRGSSAYVGGGIAACRTRNVQETWVTLRDCTIDSCFASSWGGGLYANYSIMVLERCRFLDNESNLQGSAAIFLNCSVTIDSCRFELCNSLFAENAVEISEGSGVVSNCEFIDNIAHPFGLAGHLGVNRASLVVQGCFFSGVNSGSVAINLDDIPARSTDFVGNVIEANSSTIISGTLLVWNGSGEIAYNIFRNNDNFRGGTIQTSGSINRTRIHHNVFENNTCPDSTSGSVLNNLPESQPTLDSNIFRNNSSPVIVHWSEFTDSLDARNNWWGDASGPFHPALNPNGLGDTLYSDSILFIPWLTAPPDTSMPESAYEIPPLSSTWELASVYPNPFNSEIQIIIAGFAGRRFSIRLYNLLGQEVDVVHSGSLTGGRLHYTAPSTLSSGVYFLRAMDESTVQTRKVVFLK